MTVASVSMVGDSKPPAHLITRLDPLGAALPLSYLAEQNLWPVRFWIYLLFSL